MNLRCPSCDRRWFDPNKSVGATVKCPGCGSDFSAGGAPPKPAPRPAPIDDGATLCCYFASASAAASRSR